MAFIFVFTAVLSHAVARILPPETSIFSSDKLLKDARLNPTISNGFLGFACATDTMFIGGVFNGEIALNATNKVPTSHRARVPASNNLEFDIHYETLSYTLDVEKAVYYENYSDTQMEVDNRRNSEALSFSFSNNAGKPSSDVNFTEIVCPPSSLSNLSCESGWTQIAEYDSALIRVVSVPFASSYSLSVPSEQSMTYVYPTVWMTSLECDSDDVLPNAVALFEQLYSERAQWLEQHLAEWANIWGQGRIDIVGNDTVSAAVYSSMYYIMSSLREDWTFGLSPGSLSSDDYSGHTFWDQVLHL